MPELEEPVLQLNGEELSPNSSDSEHPVPRQRPSSSTDYGKRVLFYSTQDKKEKCGVLRYLGVPEFAEGLWCGIELDQPEGKNNGSIHGIRYFICDPSYGVFVPLSKVELDPSRRVRKISAKNGSEAKKMTNGVGKSAPFIQQELTQRLTQPAITKRKNAQAGVTNWRQPMKAFATQGVSVSRQPKKPLAPFRAGGIYKTQSSENIRALRDKESSQQSKPVKKSSSERDLRSANNKTNNKTEVVKARRKPARTNSLSDISADSTATSSSSSSTDQSKRHSANLSGSKAFHRWPLTSTPSNRDDSSPDGCSSPDEADASSTSGGDGAQLNIEPLKQNGIGNTQVTADKAFLRSPDLPADPKASLPTGLATQASQLIEGERSSQGVGDCRVPSPEHGTSKPRYHNHRSGTATLDHPLTQATNAPEDVNTSASLADPFHSLEEGVSMIQMMELFKEQYKQWHTTQVMLESKVDYLEKQLQETRLSHKQEVERLHKDLQEVQTSYETKVRQQEAMHRAAVQQTHSNHQQELIALHKAHRHAMEEQQREFECQRGKHTTV